MPQARPTPRKVHRRLDVTGVIADIQEIYSVLSWMGRGPNEGQLNNLIEKLTVRTDYMRNKLITLENDMRAAGIFIPWEAEPYPEGWESGGPIAGA